MSNTLYIRMTLLAVLALSAACGQKGPLYLPPTCSPVLSDGSVAQRTDEDGNLLPPCADEEAADTPANALPEDGDDNQDFPRT